LEQDKVKARARANAYRLLHSRPRSEREIRDRLKLKKYDNSVIEDIVADLKRTGDIDDAKFARFWVESRMQFNPMGNVVLKHELKAKGVGEELIEAALKDKSKIYDEYAIASNMAQARFERLKKLDRKKASKRLYDFLMRRGFGYDVIMKVVGSLIDEDR
jgi:regulatory protein